MKPLIGLALTVGDVILVKAALLSSHAHKVHGATLASYVVGVLLSLALWAWVLRGKAKPAQRSGGYPYGGRR